MAIPVVSTVQSVLSYPLGAAFTFQPYASNTPTSWASSPLSPGITINGTTGLVSVAATGTTAGLCVFALTATNGDGSSAPVQFVIALYPSPASVSSTALLVGYELTTKQLFLLNPAGGEPSASNAAAFAAPAMSSPDGGPALPPVLAVSTYGDDFYVFLHPFSNAAPVDGSLSAAVFTMKDVDGDADFFTSSGMAKVGTGAGAYYVITGTLTGSALQAALSNSASDEGQYFTALCQLKVTESLTGGGTKTTRSQRVGWGIYDNLDS